MLNNELKIKQPIIIPTFKKCLEIKKINEFDEFNEINEYNVIDSIDIEQLNQKKQKKLNKIEQQHKTQETQKKIILSKQQQKSKKIKQTEQTEKNFLSEQQRISKKIEQTEQNKNSIDIKYNNNLIKEEKYSCDFCNQKFQFLTEKKQHELLLCISRNKNVKISKNDKNSKNIKNVDKENLNMISGNNIKKKKISDITDIVFFGNIDIFAKCEQLFGRTEALIFLCDALLKKDINNVYKILFLSDPLKSPIIFISGKYRYLNSMNKLVDDGSDYILKVIFDTIRKSMVYSHSEMVSEYIKNKTDILFESYDILSHQNSLIELSYSNVYKTKYKKEFEKLINIIDHPLNESGRQFLSIGN